MKIKRSILLTAGAVLAASLISNATTPAKPTSVDPKPDAPNTVLTPTGLATAETIFSYCAGVDRAGAANYQSGKAMILKGHDLAEAAGLRMTPEYIKTQTGLNAQLSKVSFIAGVSACRSFGSTSIRHKGSPITTPIKLPHFNGVPH